MSRHRKTHMQTGEMAEQYGKPQHVLLCGIEHSFLNTTTNDPARVTCPDCSRALAAKALAERGADAPSLALVKWEGKTYYGRFTYAIMYDGEHFGFVGLEGAYGKAKWLISVITTENEDDEKTKMGFQIEEERGNPGHTYSVKLTYASKEAALADVPRLVEAGRLKSAATTVREAKEWREELARRRARIAAEDAEEAQLKADTLVGLQEIAALAEAGKIELSNFQREALANAVLRYRGKRKDA
jgi:Arc/MetJ-type ribon-helix-helix transcriptional regulator